MWTALDVEVLWDGGIQAEQPIEPSLDFVTRSISYSVERASQRALMVEFQAIEWNLRFG